MKQRTKKRSWILRALLILFGVGVLTGVIAYFAGSAWIQNYIRSDSCREMLARRIGAAANARCEMEPLSWSGANVYSARISLSSRGAAGWKQVEADGVQASLDLGAVRRGVWRVPAIGFDWVRLNLADIAKMDAPSAEPEAGVDPGAAPVWLRRWLPTRTEIDGVDVNAFDLKPPVPGGGVSVEGLQLTAKPAAENGAWQVRGSGGKLAIPGLAEPFRIKNTSARLDAKALSLHDVSARWLGDSELTARGEFPRSKDRGWGFSGHLSNLDMRHVLSDEWNPKVSGVIEGDYEVSASPGAQLLTKGTLRVKGGVVQGLPVLDRVAEFTNTARFRRVVLDEAAADVERQDRRTVISRIVLQSNALVRLEGDIVLDGRAIRGNLLVGVSPETLRWKVWGAEKHVFDEEHPAGIPGFVWTRVRVSGTLDSPKEDLSNRLLAAMGKAVLLDAPMAVLGTGAEVLDKTRGAVLQEGKAVIEGGTEVIKGAGDVLGKGMDTIKGIIPLLPK